VTKGRGRATKFPLLVYQRVFKMWFGPSLMLLVASVVLIVFEADAMGDWQWVLLPLLLIAAGLAIYSLLARSCYVQAHPQALRVKSPLYRLVVSYGRVNVVRPTPFKAQFPPESLSWSQRRLAESLYGHTCIVAELKGYPVSKTWVAFWFHRLFLPRQVEGLALVVEDWLQLSNEFESARTDWANRRLVKRQERTVEQILRK